MSVIISKLELVKKIKEWNDVGGYHSQEFIKKKSNTTLQTDLWKTTLFYYVSDTGNIHDINMRIVEEIYTPVKEGELQ